MAATKISPTGTSEPVTSINTADLSPSTPEAQGFDSGSRPIPQPTNPYQQPESHAAENSPDPSDATNGVGTDGEEAVWEARYSKRNFIGRITTRVLATIGAVVLAYYTWAANHQNLAVVAWIAIGAVVLFWVALIWRIIQAHYSHFYRLTNRRLFVSTGVFRRRRDMMELLRVKDVFTRQQSLMDRWLELGTVVVVPTEKELPTFYLAGVDDPKGVMDMIWHHARAERDHRSVKVDSV
jgi:membrane protein YdbS with pleckstrin-like domain